MLIYGGMSCIPFTCILVAAPFICFLISSRIWPRDDLAVTDRELCLSFLANRALLKLVRGDIESLIIWIFSELTLRGVDSNVALNLKRQWGNTIYIWQPNLGDKFKFVTIINLTLNIMYSVIAWNRGFKVCYGTRNSNWKIICCYVASEYRENKSSFDQITGEGRSNLLVDANSLIQFESQNHWNSD